MPKSQEYFEIMPHDSEVSIRAQGKTLRELFLHILRGTARCLKSDILMLKFPYPPIRQKLSVEAVDINSLLIEFLTQVISNSDIHGAIFTDVRFGKFGEDFLEAEIAGAEVATFDREIKGISYEEVEIRKDPKTGRFEATLILES